MFNTTNATTSGDLLGIAQYGNEVTGGWMGVLILIAIFVLTWLTSARYESTGGSFGIAGVLCMIFSVLFYTMGLVSGHVLAYFLLIGAGSVVAYLYR